MKNYLKLWEIWNSGNDVYAVEDWLLSLTIYEQRELLVLLEKENARDKVVIDKLRGQIASLASRPTWKDFVKIGISSRGEQDD